MSLFTTLISLPKSPGTVFNFSTFNLSTSAFYLGKFNFAATLDVLTPAAPFKSAFVAYLDKSIVILISQPKGSYSLKKYSLTFIWWLNYIFLSIQLLNELS